MLVLNGIGAIVCSLISLWCGPVDGEWAKGCWYGIFALANWAAFLDGYAE